MIALNPAQVGVLAQAELCMHTLAGAASAAQSANAVRLAAAYAACVKLLEKAHEEFMQDAQRTVSIAAPADVARLVQP